MRVNLLGPFEVHTGGSCVNAAPAAQKVRQTLALLALNANRVVRSEQLMEELWGDHPPVSAHTALQTYVYQIRKRFELGNPRSGGHARGTARPVLSTVDGGYHLALPAEHVDALRFEPLIARARREFRAGDVPRARDAVAAALTLWRDAALVDVRKGAVLEAEALRLDELHTSADNLRIEADLHLGRHHELLGELTSRAALEPTDEGVLRHLMTALYRTDRRSDALRVYQRARRRIAEEFGLDPSPELQALHTAILQSDESVLRP
ncbi:AfsR/SARP family transcriptional regulator, partial [Streptomyces sp. TRM64462]|uniref:AfsR/SARP family transcriptional regulator n=1 Tax=Streptomyces sp. TRM64462 TaxID=2741726 RepID=UPI0015868E9E